MLELLATWIIIQLLIIGSKYGERKYEIDNKIKPSKKKKMSKNDYWTVGLLFPLLAFIPEDETEKERVKNIYNN